MLVGFGGKADLLQGCGEPDPGRGVGGIDLDRPPVETHGGSRIVRIGENASQVDPAKPGGRKTRGFDVRSFSLLVELVGMEDHAETAPRGCRVGRSGGGAKRLLDCGPDAGFDGGEVGSWELGGLDDKRKEQHG